MRTKSFFAWGLSFLGLVLGSSNACAQSANENLVLVSSTEFAAIGYEDSLFSSINLVNDFEGVCTPQITIGKDYTLTSDVASSYSEGTFLSGKHYGISYDSRLLDTLRFDDAANDWGIVFSAGNKMVSTTTQLLSYSVNGLKNAGEYKVVVEVCNPLNEDYLNRQSTLNKSSMSKGGPSLSDGYSIGLKVGTNNTNYSGMDGISPMTAGSSETYTITNPTRADFRFGFITNGTLNVNIYMSQSGAYSAVKIKSIKVYAELDPKISGRTSDCVGGKNVTFKLNDKYNNCTYQWYKDGVKIAGATGVTYTHTTGNDPGKEYEFYCEISTANGENIKSNTINFEDRECCQDDKGNPADEKLIWQDDFGTFTEEGKYWIWDYTDINNPVKVSKTTADGWTYELPYTIPGANYKSIVAGEGIYSVAANVTSIYDGATTGTLWEWQANTHYGDSPKSYGASFAPDHTYNGGDYGAMLFLNCGNVPNAVIYEKEIGGLCEKDVKVRCFVSNFSRSANPVKIKIKVTDMASQNSETSATIERFSQQTGETSYNEATAWEKVEVSISLTGATPKLKFEIISEGGGDAYNEDGNDLILDDIQVWTCSAPNVDLSVEDNMLHVVETPMIENYYKDKAAYIYQYTFDDPSSMSFDKTSWKAVPGSKITSNVILDDLSEVFMEKDAKDTAYFRVVLGSKEVLTELGLDHSYNANEVCAAYSVSNPVAYKMIFVSCTSPLAIKIKADKAAAEKKNGKDVIELCYGESITLSQAADITPSESEWADPDFEGFAIKWLLNTQIQGDMYVSEKVLNGVISPMAISYDEKIIGGTELPVVISAVDAIYPDGECRTADTIYVRFNASPSAQLSKSSVTFVEGDGAGKVDLTLDEDSISNYTIHWWYGKDTSGTALENNLTSAFFEALTPAESGTYSYQIVDDSTGCVGDVHSFDVTVKEHTNVETVAAEENNDIVNVYTASGSLVKSNVKKSEALNGLANGAYVVGGEKVIKK